MIVASLLSSSLPQARVLVITFLPAAHGGLAEASPVGRWINFPSGLWAWPWRGEERPLLVLQVRMVRGELVDESGGSPLEWIGLIRAARNPQEQTLEAIADLPGGQVLWAFPPHRQFYLPNRY